VARRVSLGDFSLQRPTRAEISLDALEANVASLRTRVGGKPILGVVKADAYGHGAVPVARCFQRLGLEHLAVALVEEAAELRQGGISIPILVMGALEPSQMRLAVQLEVTPAIFRQDQLEALETCAAAASRRVPYHLKLDTGMGRLGVPWRAVSGFLRESGRFHHLDLQGIFSHLACADDPSHPLTRIQLERFEAALATARSLGYRPRACHLANSAAVLDHPPVWLDLVRPGLALYGYHPSSKSSRFALRPVMRMSSRIVYLKEIQPGDSVGYGATATASRSMCVATVAAGYDDGVMRSLSNRGHFLVRGASVPILGRVSMDLTTLDVSDVPGASLGDEAVFLGAQDSAFQGADQVAEEAGTIPWEILCGIGSRVPRVYLRGGEIVEVRSRFGSSGGQG
jgi:alanine racemase